MIELPRVRPFVGKAIRPVLVDARIEGGGAFGWSPVTGTADGGGWWEWTTRGMMAFRPDHRRALRAVAALVRGGETIRVPVTDDPQRLSPLPDPVPFSDGASFSDDTLFAGNAVEAVLDAPVALRDDEATIWIKTGQELRGGDYFSLERTGRGPELHLTTSVEPLGSGRWRVRVAPNFRAAHPAGAVCEFDRPAFEATIPDTSTLWPEYGTDWIGEAEVTFVEAP